MSDMNLKKIGDDFETEWGVPTAPKKAKKSLIILIICMIVAVVASGAIGYFIALGTKKLVSKEDYDFIQKYDVNLLNKFDLLLKTLSYTSNNYYEDIDYDEFDKLVTLAMMRDFDEFSSMSSASDLISNAAISAGIGIVMSPNTFNEFTIVQVLEGSSSEGKLQRGDVLLEIDGHRVINAPSTYIAYYLQGDVGATFKIKVQRGLEKVEVTVAKAEYKNSQAYYISNLGGDISPELGYINLRSFVGTAAEDFAACIEKFKKDDKKGLILDLRDNGGGSGDILADIASYLVMDFKKPFNKNVPIMEFVRTKTNSTNVIKTTNSSNFIGGANNSKPIYILANNHSASSSEALIGAMLYYGTGTLIGETTFGKGVGQVTSKIVDNDGKTFYLSLVEGYYYVYTNDLVNHPNGKMNIHKKGFTPNEENIIKIKSPITPNFNEDNYIIHANDLYKAIKK